MGSISLLTVLFWGAWFGALGRGIVGVFFPLTPPSVASTSAVVSRHCPPPARRSGEVPAEHRWSWWDASWFLCEQRESELRQAVLFPSP